MIWSPVHRCLSCWESSADPAFQEDLLRPHVMDTALDDGYRAMATDTLREAEAMEWCNALAGDMADAAR